MTAKPKGKHAEKVNLGDMVTQMTRPQEDVDVLMTSMMDENVDGIRVKRIGDSVLCVVRTLANWHLVQVPADDPWDWRRYWCYTGLDVGSYLTAVLAAAVWDPRVIKDPPGWNKNSRTGEYRPRTELEFDGE